MDIENLSKEELIALIKKQGSATTKSKQETTVVNLPGTTEQKFCTFQPTSSKGAPCQTLSSTEWGFCKKHSTSIQGRKAQKEYEEAHAPKIVEPPKVITPSPSLSTSSLNSSSQLSKSQSSKSQSITTSVGRPQVKNQQLPSKKEPQPTKKNQEYEYSYPSRTEYRHPTKETSNVRKIHIKPNKWGRYEEPESHICFDSSTKTAYGVQDPSGKLLALSPKHIALCEKNKWKYTKHVEEEDSESEESESEDEEDKISDQESESDAEESENEGAEESEGESEAEEEEDESEAEDEEESEAEEESEEDYDSGSD